MLVTIVGAKGAPGVTTTALACAMGWPRDALLAEADPAGHTIPFWLDGRDGPISPQVGMHTLAAQIMADRRPELLLAQAQRSAQGAVVVVGPPSAKAATAIKAWPEIAAAATDLPDRDVIADLGRYVDARSSVTSLVTRADQVCVVTRTDLASLHHALLTVGEVGDARSSVDQVEVLTVHPGRDRNAHNQFHEALRSQPGLSSLRTRAVAWDPRTARGLRGEGLTLTAGRSALLKWATQYATELSDRFMRSYTGDVVAR